MAQTHDNKFAMNTIQNAKCGALEISSDYLIAMTDSIIAKAFGIRTVENADPIAEFMIGKVVLNGWSKRFK